VCRCLRMIRCLNTPSHLDGYRHCIVAGLIAIQLAIALLPRRWEPDSTAENTRLLGDPSVLLHSVAATIV
jgi:hypothetical protein